MHYKAGN